MANLLVQRGVLRPCWRTAFEEVPRHVFVPSFYADDGTLVDGDDPTRHEEWLTAVYSDDSLGTQRALVRGTDLVLPTSSSTMPSLMARMLDLLDVHDGQPTLEVGTGTGYNAALLCHRLGDTNVTSIDIDPGLVDTARRRLNGIGYRPHLVAGDGALGVPDQAPYARIIATAAVTTVPAAWVTQLAPDGLIVTDVRGELASSLITLRKNSRDTVFGRFLGVSGHFMWLRARADNPLREAGTLNNTFDLDSTHTATTDIAPDDLQDPEFRFVLQLLVPGIQWIGRSKDGQGEVLTITCEDASWVKISTSSVVSRYQVTCGGPRPVWPSIDNAWHTWQRWGRPARGRFGITASTSGEQHLWLDNPDGAHCWPTPL